MVLTAIETLFRPQSLPNLGQINIILKIWKEGTIFDEVNLSLPSYYTLEDIKREYYIKYPDVTNLPRFVFMGIQKGQFYEAIDYTWTSSDKVIMNLQYPTKTTLVRPDMRWVTEDGEPIYFQLKMRNNLLIEDLFSDEIANQLSENIDAEPSITIYVYHLVKLLSAYKGVKPISSVNWYSRLAPYFPNVKIYDEPTEDDINIANYINTFVNKRRERVDRINELISYEYPTYPFTLKGIQRLRLHWKAAELFKGCEMFFYETDVTHQRPFMRLLGATGQPINKIYTKGQLPIPDIADPELLRQWAREQSPKPGLDYVFTKNILREEHEGLRAVYGTMRVFNEGSADYIIVPPKKERLLQTNIDLVDFSDKVEKVVEGTPFIYEPELGDASLVFTMTIPLEEPKVTIRTLAKKLPCFTPFFQLIKPYVQDMPQIMLRYKMVSNFVEEGRISTYLTFLSEKLRAQSADIIPSEWIPKVADEFQLSREEATKAVENWLQNRSLFTVAKEEDIYKGKHPGIDIAIYEHHPQYSFHILGVDSPQHLPRIITLLQLLFSAPEEEFKCSSSHALQKAQTILQAEVNPIPADTLIPEIKPKQITNKNIQGNFDEDLMFDIGEDEEDDAPIEMPVQVPVQQDIAKMKQEFIKATQQEESPDENIKETITSKDAPVLKEFFINLLKKNDPALFDYERVGKQNPYSRKCSATVYAQPLVLSYEQFMKNYNTYINDTDVVFTVYPYNKKAVIPDGAEEYTFLRYGTDPKKDLFYTCPTIYCVRDSMIIRPRDFASNTDRQGRSKPRNSCPFCYGLQIVNQTTGTQNHTVIVRIGKDDPNKPLKYVGFMKSTDHPQGFRFPCCYIDPPDKSKTSTDRWMLISNPAFDKQREWIQKGLFHRIDGINEVDEDDDEEGEYDEESIPSILDIQSVTTTMLEDKIRSYLMLFSSIHLEYIQNPEKILIQGTFGLLPSSLEEYFAQNNSALAKSTKGRQSVLPNSEGFLRVGVGNIPKYKPDSLLLALAPVLGRNTLREVKQFLLEKISPYFFIQLNYGNLVHEFFDPSYPIPPGGEEEMMRWAALYLNVDRRSENRAAVFRMWKSYHRFIDHIISEHETKELRVFGPILTYAMLTPNTPNGCILAVLEYDVNNQDTPVQVLCPTYGISPQAKDIADVCFITRTKEGFYEPIIYTKNKAATGTTYAQHLYTLKWQRAEQVGWPQIIKQRINEFMNQCEGPGRTIYPSQEIDPYSIIGVNSLFQVAARHFPRLIRGMVRESYNHITALLFAAREDSESYVAVPCVDDGYLITHLFNIALDWNGYTPASIDDCVNFYDNYIIPNFSLYKGYKIVRGLKPDGMQIVAARLENGLKIPCSPPRNPINIPVQTGKIELQWIQDDIIAYGDSTLPKTDVNINIINELYEHFRLSFGAWLVREEQNESRRSIKSILENESLEGWEKWKRLDILLRSTLTRWLDDEEYSLNDFSMLRKDCINITDAGECSGVCKWRGSAQPTDDIETQGKCLIHIPKTFKKSSTVNISVSELFMFRLYDDLIRFPQKRDELFDNTVSRLKKPTEAILIDNQWILPETSVDWTELLRLEWARERFEEPKHYEEISASEEEQKLIASKKSTQLDRLRPELINYLGSGAENLLIWTPPITDEILKQPYLPFISVIGSFYEAGLPIDAKELTEEVIKKVAEQKNKSILVVNPQKNIILIGRPLGYTIRDIYKGFYLIIEEEGVLPSLVVASKSTAVLQEDQLPKTVRDENRKKTPRPLLRKI
jgi:hypothetical protein